MYILRREVLSHLDSAIVLYINQEDMETSPVKENQDSREQSQIERTNAHLTLNIP